MADGKGKRWNLYNGVQKHFVEFNGEKIIERTVRLLCELKADCEIIITSHCPQYEFDGAVRYEPQNNILEIDRFTKELIDDNVCFLYGDTYYTNDGIRDIVEKRLNEITFFGNSRSIVGVKVENGKLFKKHIGIVRTLYLQGTIDQCIGWQVYQSYCGLAIGGQKVIQKNFIQLSDDTFDLNSPDDYLKLKKREQKW